PSFVALTAKRHASTRASVWQRSRESPAASSNASNAAACTPRHQPLLPFTEQALAAAFATTTGARVSRAGAIVSIPARSFASESRPGGTGSMRYVNSAGFGLAGLAD